MSVKAAMTVSTSPLPTPARKSSIVSTEANLSH
jgi:hypothetical protein